MRNCIALILAVTVASTAHAQVSSSGPPVCADGLPCATQSSVPTKGAVVPPGATPGGSIGIQNSFTPIDATQPGLTRSAKTTTDGSCNFAVTWTVPLVSSTPVAFAYPTIPSGATQPSSCNTTAITSAGVTGKCFTAQTTLLNLSIVTTGLTLNSQGGTCSGMSVSVFAREPTN